MQSLFNKIVRKKFGYGHGVTVTKLKEINFALETHLVFSLYLYKCG